jgi:hypothetical protein
MMEADDDEMRRRKGGEKRRDEEGVTSEARDAAVASVVRCEAEN